MKKISLRSFFRREKDRKTGVKESIERLQPLIEVYKQARTTEERIALLDTCPDVKNFIQSSHPLVHRFGELSSQGALIVKSLVVLQQVDRLLPKNYFSTNSAESLEADKRFQTLLEQLASVEKFYHEIGGLLGYHWMVLKFLGGERGSERIEEERLNSINYSPVQGIDIQQTTPLVDEMVLWGLRHLPQIAEIYPLGGAADRLRFQDEKTGVPLPAAKLPFLGKTLFEHLVADLEAREYLYYQLFGESICTPIAVMTSPEKDNHAHVLAICEEKQWFGRPKESFRFFCQPLVPTVNEK